MRICVLGLYHLGCVTAACAAAAGNEVVALDPNTDVIKELRNGRPPLFEPGLAELIAEGVAEGRLSFTSDFAAVADVDILWVCHDTPVDEEDRADVACVVKQVHATFPYLKDGSVVLVSAQLPVGTIAALEAAYKTAIPGRQVSFACSPENLRLGRAIEIFRNPGRIIVGVRDMHTREMVEPLLLQFCNSLIWTSVESAEMAKHALNAFLAVSITFTNEIASICEKVGADATEVEKALRSEPRVGQHAYVRPGPAFAGGTLARDIQFLTAIAAQQEVQVPLLDGVIPSNRAHRQWVMNKLRQRLAPLAGKRVALLGLSYKPGTDSIRRSSAIEILRELLAEGTDVVAFDPAVRWLPEEFDKRVGMAANLGEALSGANAVVIATEWPEFRSPDSTHLAKTAAGCLILDPSRFLDPNAVGGAKILSIGAAS